MVRKRALTDEAAQALILEYRGWDFNDKNDRRSIQWFATKYGVSVATVNRCLREADEPKKTYGRPSGSTPFVDATQNGRVMNRYLDALDRISVLEAELEAVKQAIRTGESNSDPPPIGRSWEAVKWEALKNNQTSGRATS
jgi:hypothetical protein